MHAKAWLRIAAALVREPLLLGGPLALKKGSLDGRPPRVDPVEPFRSVRDCYRGRGPPAWRRVLSLAIGLVFIRGRWSDRRRSAQAVMLLNRQWRGHLVG